MFSLRLYYDDELFQAWYRNHRTRQTSAACTESCKVGQLCDMWFANYDEARECRKWLQLPDYTTMATFPGDVTTADSSGRHSVRERNSCLTMISVWSAVACCLLNV